MGCSSSRWVTRWRLHRFHMQVTREKRTRALSPFNKLCQCQPLLCSLHAFLKAHFDQAEDCQVSSQPANYKANMTNYLSIPIIDEFVKLIQETPNNEDHVKALLSGMLNHYFPLTSGYCIVPRTNRDDSYPNFTVSRLQSRFPGERGVIDHVLVKVKRPSGYPGTLDRPTHISTRGVEERTWPMLGRLGQWS